MTGLLRKYWTWLAAGLALIALSVSTYFLPLGDWVRALSSTVERLGPFGVVVFVLVYAAATVLFVPGSVLTLAAGLVFGVALGTLAAWSGAMLGASLAFVIARYLARSTVEEKVNNNQKLRAIDEAIGKQGWKIVGLMRLSPLIPFVLSNYFYGITKIGFWPYLFASAGGMLPGTLLYVYLGAAGKVGLTGAKEHSPLQYTFFALGLLATLGVTIWVSRIAKRALAESGATTNDPKDERT